MKTSEDIYAKAEAMKMKLKMFGISNVKMTAYYGDNSGSITLYDNTNIRYPWYVFSLRSAFISFIAKSEQENLWLQSLAKRKTTIDLYSRFKAQICTDEDYCMCFDWLKRCAANSGGLVLARLRLMSCDTVEHRKFFLPTDTPETIAIEWDLYNGDNMEK